MAIDASGTASFWAKHDPEDWPTDPAGVVIGTLDKDGISMQAVKHQDKTVAVLLTGPYGKSFSFRAPFPPCGPKGLHVSVMWSNRRVVLYLNGKETQVQMV
jgi:hypothetical protein